MKRLLIRTYHLVPLPLRRMVYRLGPVARLRRRYFEQDSSLHDEYYTGAYFDGVEFASTRQAAPMICRAMIRDFQPTDVLDVGCGNGDYLEAFRDAGIPARGVELASAALERCRAKGLEVARVDLSRATELPWTADLVFSFEVAEHIPEESAPGFVRALTAAARRHVCLTAAAPGQVGLCHVNCQPKSYWIRLFAERGFVFDEALTGRWQRANTEADLANWLCHNLMIFHAPAGRPGPN
jgi:SAM-dependent methyltransferase